MSNTIAWRSVLTLVLRVLGSFRGKEYQRSSEGWISGYAIATAVIMVYSDTNNSIWYSLYKTSKLQTSSTSSTTKVSP